MDTHNTRRFPHSMLLFKAITYKPGMTGVVGHDIKAVKCERRKVFGFKKGSFHSNNIVRLRRKIVTKCNCGAKKSSLDSACGECLQSKTREELKHHSRLYDGANQPNGLEPLLGGESASFSLSTLLYILATLSLFVGVLLGGRLWPDDPGYGKSLGVLDYIPACISISVGLVQFSLLAAFGRTLEYLKIIASNASRDIRPNKKTKVDR